MDGRLQRQPKTIAMICMFCGSDSGVNWPSFVREHFLERLGHALYINLYIIEFWNGFKRHEWMCCLKHHSPTSYTTLLLEKTYSLTPSIHTRNVSTIG